jgi:hypothetical protein
MNHGIPVNTWIRAGSIQDPFKKSVADVISLLDKAIDAKKEEILKSYGENNAST